MSSERQHLKAMVSTRREITRDLWVVRLRPEEPIVFVPGQYLTVGLPAGGKLVERPYSVASALCETEIEFFLEVVPGGKLSPQLYEVPVGGEVFVRRTVKGRFTFDLQSGRRLHFMAATVTGVAPFVSMLRHLAARANEEPVRHHIFLLHSASVSAELAYSGELSVLADAVDWLQYVPTISRIWLEPDWSGERGRLEDVARKYLDSMAFEAISTTAYLCGNPRMIRTMTGVLERAGFEKDHIKTEMYWPD